MATLNEKQARVLETTGSGFRGRLLARGQARSMIWREGVLPANAPEFSQELSYDLLAYAYALLSDGLDILENDGDADVARTAFDAAASAIEAVVAKGETVRDRDFNTLMAASAYHLARYSARAFSLLSGIDAESNHSLPERCLAMLMLRRMDDLNELITKEKSSSSGSDNTLLGRLTEMDGPILNGNSDESDTLDKVLDTALTDGFLNAMSIATLAFERGDESLIQKARETLSIGMKCAAEINFEPHWWSHRLAIFLIGDLWRSSFHVRLPNVSPDDASTDWPELRALFITSLYKRARAEIDLWPSQVDAAAKALNIYDNMVISLPTSAGKTRIAELCILACLAAKKRVVFVTPLRALSAQTEVSLNRTFEPLGKSVSSLYGSIGVGSVDQGFLRERDIIVATPEKLDFAIRNDPSLLDDVGLIVLDEGHMIGLGEREVRYEVQIQKLLMRTDAAERRIVCLSAILPSGEKLEDFVGWVTEDHPDGLIQKDWRPTRLRFGEIEWRGDNGWLHVSVGEERPFAPRYIEQRMPTSGKRTAAFPRDQRELCLATAWRLVDEGQSVLIYCPRRASVEPFATAIVDLHKKGFLQSVLDVNEDQLQSALVVGAEWFQPDHDILKCLKLGIAIHHGALPTPFRKEIERLLREGVLKITISSPTLAQGLNLSATSLVMHGLYRTKELMEISEFRNVVGRAGRAFVDVEGLVLYPMFNKVENRRRTWNVMLNSNAGKEMESGLLRLVQYLLARMFKKHNPQTVQEVIDYIANQAWWDFPEIEGETDETIASERIRWHGYIARLDTAVLGLLGETEVADEDIEDHLDAVLQSSLWKRRLARREEQQQQLLTLGLQGRAKYIWANSTAKQRRAYFLAGVGLNTGQQLDANAPVLNTLLVNANSALAANLPEDAISYITQFAELIFTIEPFTPDVLPVNWRDILHAWLSGTQISNHLGNADADTLKFIEGGLIYRLPWGMEAVRVRGVSHNDPIDEMMTLSDVSLDLAVPAVETGTVNISAALLMKSGFSSRSSALKVISDTGAVFTSTSEMRAWLRSRQLQTLTKTDGWPTAETEQIWRAFVKSLSVSLNKAWKKHLSTIHATWKCDPAPNSGAPVRLMRDKTNISILSAENDIIGFVPHHLGDFETGLMLPTVAADNRKLDCIYFGPKNPVGR